MAIGFADPFDALFRFQRALEQQLESDWLEDVTTGTGAFPPINIFQQGSDFVAIIEMSGVSKDDLNLEVRGNTVRISGKKAVDYGGAASMHRRERIAGTFDRNHVRSRFLRGQSLWRVVGYDFAAADDQHARDARPW